MLAGAGALAVKNAGTAQWEVLQYATATLTGANSYNLSAAARPARHRGRHAGNPVPTGARVVVLDATALDAARPSLDNRALAQDLRYGPSTPVDDASYTEVDGAVRAASGLRPWSVSQIARRARDPASGDVAFTWVRRTRFAGDSWDPDTRAAQRGRRGL